jgi:hypothetical protein
MMESEFIIMIDGQLQHFTNYADIPEQIDHVIKFSPWVPPPPHTHAQHEEIDSWVPRLQELIKRERGTKR